MAGNAEPSQDGMGANVSLTFNPDGEKVSGFTKLHPVPVYKEDLHYEKGKTIETFECNGFTVSPFISDLRFPEAFDRSNSGRELVSGHCQLARSAYTALAYPTGGSCDENCLCTWCQPMR